MVVSRIPSSDLEAFRRTESSRLSCVSPGTLFVLKYCSLTRCEGRFSGHFPHILHNTSGLVLMPASCGGRAWSAGVAGTLILALLL